MKDNNTAVIEIEELIQQGNLITTLSPNLKRRNLGHSFYIIISIFYHYIRLISTAIFKFALYSFITLYHSLNTLIKNIILNLLSNLITQILLLYLAYRIVINLTQSSLRWL